MKALGLDTTTYHGSLAVYEEGSGLLASVNLLTMESHSRRLLPTLEWLLDRLSLDLSDFDVLAAAAGPGSFTGLRIGLSAVKGLALSAGIPAVGVPTLEAMALKAGALNTLVCPMLDARRGEVYAALFRTDAAGRATDALLEPVVARPGDFLPDVAAAAAGEASDEGRVVFVGDGAAEYAELLASTPGLRSRRVSADDLFIGSQVARLGLEALVAGAGAVDAADLSAIYLRPSDAELSTRRRAGEEAD